MFNIDKPSLIQAIAISLEPNLRNEEDKKPHYIKYFHVVMDMALGVMNSSIRNIDSAIDEQLERFPEDNNLPWLTETIRYLVVDIKTQFLQAGYDSRLKYKLVSRDIGLHKFFGIAMDIDATVTSYMLNLPEDVEDDKEIAFVVSEEPTLEQLNTAFNW